MKRLFLLRHAKSSWDEPGLRDHDRPLAPRGQKATELVAGHLQRAGIRPELVLCSSARRTRETLDGIRPALGDQAEVRIEADLYGASAPELVDVLRGVADEVESVMLIGHNPGIEDLALRLARPGPEVEHARAKFPTAALATLELEGSWRTLGPEGAELATFVKPKDLR